MVIHPGFLLGRERDDALEAVVAQLSALRERLGAKGRAVPFGLEVMGRVRELGSLDDVIAICRRLEWGEGTLRAEPLAEALTAFARPATVISESPDETSTQQIRAVLQRATAPAA